MNIKRLIVIGFIFPLMLLLSSCTNSQDGYMTNKGSNFFGLMKYEQGSYVPPAQSASEIRTDELIDRRNISGDKITLFWGLIEINDF